MSTCEPHTDSARRTCDTAASTPLPSSAHERANGNCGGGGSATAPNSSISDAAAAAAAAAFFAAPASCRDSAAAVTSSKYTASPPLADASIPCAARGPVGVALAHASESLAVGGSRARFTSGRSASVARSGMKAEITNWEDTNGGRGTCAWPPRARACAAAADAWPRHTQRADTAGPRGETSREVRMRSRTLRLLRWPVVVRKAQHDQELRRRKGIDRWWGDFRAPSSAAERELTTGSGRNRKDNAAKRKSFDGSKGLGEHGWQSCYPLRTCHAATSWCSCILALIHILACLPVSSSETADVNMDSTEASEICGRCRQISRPSSRSLRSELGKNGGGTLDPPSLPSPPPPPPAPPPPPPPPAPAPPPPPPMKAAVASTQTFLM
eukprot:5779794-Pleurochrysis_carterae.AAC.1